MIRMQNGFNKEKKLKKYMKVSCCHVQISSTFKPKLSYNPR
jgi:hypothetical protein